MNDKELIAEIRDLHARQDRREGEPPMCLACSPVDWPCDAVRAADALDAATEGDYHEGLEEGIKIGRAECDAALAAIERIRQAVSGHPECDRYEEGDVISCGWKSAYASVVAALDGAPEPEWEYGFHFLDDDGTIYKTRGGWDAPEKAQALGDEWIVDERESHMLNDQPDIHVALIRRRKAGPWEPVGGETDGE